MNRNDHNNDDFEELGTSNNNNKIYKTSNGPFPEFPRLPPTPTIQNSTLTEISLALMDCSKRSIYREAFLQHSAIEAAYGNYPEPISSMKSLLLNQKDLFPQELFRIKGANQRKGLHQILQPEEDDGPKPKLSADDDEGEEDEEQEDDPLLELDPDESESDNDYTTNYYDDEPADDYDDDNEDAI